MTTNSTTCDKRGMTEMLMATTAQAAHFCPEVHSKHCPDVRELLERGGQLDPRLGTFPFDHARLAWLESHGEGRVHDH